MLKIAQSGFSSKKFSNSMFTQNGRNFNDKCILHFLMMCENF